MSLPRKWQERRDQSPPALCGRYDPFLDGYCAAPVQLVVTRSPLTDAPWVYLVVTRCLSGHVHTVRGVEPDLDCFAEDEQRHREMLREIKRLKDQRPRVEWTPEQDDDPGDCDDGRKW